jgi:DNA gyrase subunit A
VSVLGRNTQGVRVIRTKDGETLVGLERIDEPDEDLEGVDDEQTKDAEINDTQTHDEAGGDNAEPQE